MDMEPQKEKGKLCKVVDHREHFGDQQEVH
jgi:hypothetical protein